MSENQAMGDMANSEAGRERRANTAESRRTVESRDRAPEVYVEGEQVARLVETRRDEAAPQAPAVSWFDDAVAPSAAPAPVATLERPVESAPAPPVETVPGQAPVTAAATRTPAADDRLIDEFDVVVRGLDDADSAMNSAFPRLGKQDPVDIFDPAAFEFPPPGEAPEGMMTPAVEPPIPGQGTIDLSGNDGGDDAQPDFGRPNETERMTPAVEPTEGDNSYSPPSPDEDRGSGRPPVESQYDEPRARTSDEQEPVRGLPNDRNEKTGDEPARGLPGEKSAPDADGGLPTRIPGLPGSSRGEDASIPTRPGVEDLVEAGRRELEDEPAAKSAPPVGGREPAPVARDIEPATEMDSLDVFPTRPAAGLPARDGVAETPARETVAEAVSRVPEPAARTAPERTAEIETAVTGDSPGPGDPGVLPGKGFFDDAPARESPIPEPLVSARDTGATEPMEDDARLPVDDVLDAPARFDVPEPVTEEYAPLKFDDDNLDDG